MRCIEQANPDTLHGIFGDAQWTNKERLSDALLKDLIEHFSSLSLGNDNCKADILGQAYEYLIKKFADLTNKKAGEFYTPRSVVALMVRILAPKAGETIYDPARDLPPIDRLEGFRPREYSMYQRVLVTASAKCCAIFAWFFVMNAVGTAQRLGSGKWNRGL